MSSLKTVVSRFSKKNILIIGDIILDRYIQGRVTRISPEAPVPVVLEENFSYNPGGAANVAHNLSALGARVTQMGKIGNDFEGQQLKRHLKQKKIDTSGIFVDKNIHTITKTRVVAQHQQVVRIDREKTKFKPDKTTDRKIADFIKKHIKDYDAVIISDYGKGLVTADLVHFLCDLCAKHKKILTVDPKVEHFGYYRNVTAITPNRNEAQNAIRNIKITQSSADKLAVNDDKLDTDKKIDRAGEQLLNFLDLESLLITLGEDGMRLFQKGKKPVVIKTRAREVFDVTGAGDAVISVFTLALTAGATKAQAANMANIAAGIVVAKLGAVAVGKEELLKALAVKK